VINVSARIASLNKQTSLALIAKLGNFLARILTQIFGMNIRRFNLGALKVVAKRLHLKNFKTIYLINAYYQEQNVH
jgi:hypothetical protein